MDAWNKRQIPKPPECTLKYSAEERREKNFDVCLQTLLEGILCGHAALNHYEVIGCWEREAAFLSASLQQEIRHRKDKYFRILKKVNKTVQRWGELKIRDYLSVLQDLTPSVPEWNRNVRVPSRQMYEYLLVRVYGGFRLLLCIEGYCREAAGYLVMKMRTGYCFSTASAFIANVARIRALALDLAGQLAEVYDAIYPLLDNLKGNTASSLFEKKNHPPSLTSELTNYCKSIKKTDVDITRKNKPDLLAFLHILKDDEAEESTFLEAFEFAETKTSEGRSEEQQEIQCTKVKERSHKDENYNEAMKLLDDIGQEEGDSHSSGEEEDKGFRANDHPSSFTSKLKNYCKSKDKDYHEALKLLNDICQEEDDVTSSKQEDLGVHAKEGDKEELGVCMNEEEDIGMCVKQGKKRKRENVKKSMKKLNKCGGGNFNQPSNSANVGKNAFSNKRKRTGDESGKNKKTKSQDKQSNGSATHSKFKKGKKSKFKKGGQ